MMSTDGYYIIFKVIPINKCPSDILQLTDQFRYQFVREVIMDILRTKEIITCDRRDSQGNEKKMQFLFLLFVAITFLTKIKI